MHGSPYGYAQPYGWAPARSTNTMAVVSLVLGVLGITTCTLFGIGSLICGYRGRREIEESGGTQDGSGLATAGIVLGWVTMALTVAVVVGVLVILLAAASSTS